jgi:hypothetical protein
LTGTKGQDVRHFDLRSISSSDAGHADRANRWIGSGVIAIFVAIAGYFVANFLAHHDSFSGQQVWLLVFALVICGFFCVVGALYYSAGKVADELQLTEEGVTAILKGDEIFARRWTDPHLSWRIELRQSTPAGQVSRPPLIVMFDRFPRRVNITSEAFQALLEVARLRGLKVESGPSSSPGFTRTTIRAG